ncbi:hypothetical protein [Pseudomonas sp. RIT-To-2]|uniref:hypothetical protein n=1 Tax=Pseudomonas sp. RIT-To-2 TaxID=3462541 RepID=UPI002413B5DF
MNQPIVHKFETAQADQDVGDQMAAVNGYLQMVSASAQETLGKQLDCQIFSLRNNGMGDFNWSYSNGQTTQVNGASYNWISAAMTVADANHMVSMGNENSFNVAYQSFIQGIYYQFSVADQKALQASQNAASTQSAALVAAFNTTFGTPTANDYANATTAMNAYPAYGPSTEINFIIDYVMGSKWAGSKGPFTNTQMQNTASLSTLLANAPANAGTVLPLATEYLVALGQGTALTDQANLANMQIGAMKRNLLTPTANNGGITVFNAQANQPNNPTLPAYTVSPPIPQDPSLQQNSIDAAFKAQATSDSSWNVSYSGQAGISVGEFLSFNASTTVSGDIASQCGSSATMSVTVTYPNIVATPAISSIPQGLSAVAADGSATGWFSESIVKQAYTNTQLGSAAPSGFAFIGGAIPENFGYPSTIVLSGYPEISVTVTNGSYSDFQSWQKTHTSFSVSLFGFISLGGGSVNTYTSTVTSAESESSFTFKLTGPSKSPVTNPAQQVYPVLGVGVTYLDI